MKKILFSLSVFLITAIGIAQAAGPHYTFPEGAFAVGLSNTGGWSAPNIYMPYSPDARTWTSTTGSGTWLTNSKEVATNATSYSTTYELGYSYYTPVLKAEDDATYQYGGGYTGSNTFGRVYNGTGSFVYLTPARLFDLGSTDGVSQASSNQYSMVSSFRASANDKMGEYFNNTDVMYIDEVTFAVTANKSGATVADLFPTTDAHVVATIYPATIKNVDGKISNSADFSKPIASATLTQENLSEISSVGVGVLVWKLESPISIDGAFVIEVTEMKKSGCTFYFRSDKSATNNTSYYYNESTSKYTFPTTTGGYSPNFVFSIHAMFPALYKDDASQEELNVMAGGSTKVAIHSNVDPAQFTIECPEWITYDISYEDAGGFKATALSYITFTSSNTSVTEPGTITINNRGKEISYTINQTSSIFEKGDNVETIRFVPSKTDNKTVAITTNLAPEAVAVTNTASEWLDYELTAVEGGLSLNLTTKGAATVSRKGVVTLTADNKTVSYDVRQDVVKLVVTDAKWSTYISAVGFTPEVEGLAIKTVTFDGDKLEYTDVTKITQFEPVVLYSEKPYSKPYSFSTNVYSFVFEDSYTSGPLVGVLVDTDVTPASTDSYNYYFLQNLNGVVAWYLGEENVTYTVTANHCYLKIEKSAGAPVRAFYFDTPTGLDALTTQLATGKNVRTNLAGQVVNDSYKGIVIENGKKFIKK